MSAKFLSDELTHPTTNDAGNVVWGTRYYLESLITAYQATQNLKYIKAFVDSGTTVMSLMKTVTFANEPPPINPADVTSAPRVSLIGFPTLLSGFGVTRAIPTATGGVSMYVQDLQADNPVAATSLRIDPLPGSGVLVSWLNSNDLAIQSYTITSMGDLEGLASLPLIQGVSYGRFEVTGQGMPVPGHYLLPGLLPSISPEQTSGILLPFTRFLLLAKENSGLADESLIAQWTANVKELAGNDEGALVSDGSGGLILRNQKWLPEPIAATNVAMDYMAAEATFRILLFELTNDSHELDLARGLLLHQERLNWNISSQNFFLLKFWPDFHSWKTKADAPPGSIWDEFVYDNTTPAPATDGTFNEELLETASQYGLNNDLGITNQIIAANQNTLLQYLFVTPTSAGIIRGAYPGPSSSPSDKIGYSPDPFAASGFLSPQVTNEQFINANWNWMLQYGTDGNGGSVPYFLRAWARSEAAELSVCLKE
jgi:hypothetical protein